MKTSGFLIHGVMFCILGLVYASVEKIEDDQIETIQEENEDIVLVTDSEGKPVTEIDVYQEGDFQLIKPAAEDDYVCLVLPSFMELTLLKYGPQGKNLQEMLQESKETGCEYERVELPKELDNEVELAGCEDREIFLLRRISCLSSEDRAVSPLKRYIHCPVKYERRCICAQYGCVEKGWWWSTEKCVKRACLRYKTEYVKVLSC